MKIRNTQINRHYDKYLTNRLFGKFNNTPSKIIQESPFFNKIIS